MTHKRWIDIPSDALRSARLRKGLGYEGVARLIPVASKTWMRWEKAGRVDAAAFDRVVEILDLDVEAQAAPERVRVVVEQPMPERFPVIENTRSLLELDRILAGLQSDVADVKRMLSMLLAEHQLARVEADSS
jgi:transcriptional regulator with XRE-family HTH domain